MSRSTCPTPAKKNRNGDRFQCLFCRRGGDSDWVAAWNLLERSDDPEICLWTPKARVKALLLSRFRRRVESWAFDFVPEEANLAVLAGVGIERPATVPGKTQDTHCLVSGGRDGDHSGSL